MPVDIQRFLKTKDREGHDVVVRNEQMSVLMEAVEETGGRVLVWKDEPCTQLNRVTIVCDGPSCAGDGQGPTTLQWGEDPEAGAPKEAHGILVLELFDGRKAVFCSDGCLVDFIRKKIHKKPPEGATDIGKFKAEHCVRKMDKEG